MQGYGLHATRAGESEEDMTPERIAELRALANAATPGPWEPRWLQYPDCTIALGSEDAAFIAAARTALPEALLEIERLTNLIEGCACQKQ